jgi:lysine-N-methylase
VGTKIYTLNYVSNFKCTSSDCKNTCCQGWDVKIDKETFEKYNKVKDKKLMESIRNNISKFAIDATYKDYAKVKLDKKTKRCPFLNNSNLCTIHKKLGVDHLCLVCQTYPKKYTRFPDVMECSMSMSCEVACKLALTADNPMEVLNINISKPQRTLISLDVSSLEQAFVIRYIRTYLFKVLDSTSYTLDEKLIIIGILVQSLKDKTEVDQNGYELIAQEDFIKEIDVQTKNLENIGFDLSSYKNSSEEFIISKINILKDILCFNPGYYTESYKNHRNALLSFINYDEEKSSLNFDISRYHAASNIFSDFMKHNSHMLENYLRNYIFQVIFPFREVRESSGIFQEYLILTFNYFIMKMHLMSLLNNNPCLGKDDVISLITCFCRNYEDYFDYEEFVLNLCKHYGIDSVSKLSNIII